MVFLCFDTRLLRTIDGRIVLLLSEPDVLSARSRSAISISRAFDIVKGLLSSVLWLLSVLGRECPPDNDAPNLRIPLPIVPC